MDIEFLANLPPNKILLENDIICSTTYLAFHNKNWRKPTLETFFISSELFKR